MRSLKINGRLRFSPEDHLTTAQVKSYFSKLTSIRRQQSQSNMNTTPDQTSQTQSMDDVEVEEEHDEEDSNDDSGCDLLTQEFHRQKLRLEVNALLGMNALWDEEE